jgi:hypothetical protein
MTIFSPLARALISTSASAAVQLLTRQPVMSLSPATFVSNGNYFLSQGDKHVAFIPGWPTRLQHAAGK